MDVNLKKRRPEASPVQVESKPSLRIDVLKGINFTNLKRQRSASATLPVNEANSFGIKSLFGVSPAQSPTSYSSANASPSSARTPTAMMANMNLSMDAVPCTGPCCVPSLSASTAVYSSYSSQPVSSSYSSHLSNSANVSMMPQASSQSSFAPSSMPKANQEPFVQQIDRMKRVRDNQKEKMDQLCSLFKVDSTSLPQRTQKDIAKYGSNPPSDSSVSMETITGDSNRNAAPKSDMNMLSNPFNLRPLDMHRSQSFGGLPSFLLEKSNGPTGSEKDDQTAQVSNFKGGQASLPSFLLDRKQVAPTPAPCMPNSDQECIIPTADLPMEDLHPLHELMTDSSLMHHESHLFSPPTGFSSMVNLSLTPPREQADSAFVQFISDLEHGNKHHHRSSPGKLGSKMSPPAPSLSMTSPPNLLHLSPLSPFAASPLLPNARNEMVIGSDVDSMWSSIWK
eukprot:GILK01002475.1.p1 GENE.GILK01002475.1~~GILK01002475.1.p1  ORF type:complete len:452 (+),score=80.25 GILK01002475.1:259-1614(+)